MAYVHPKLIYALIWKFPGQQGISTSGGGLIDWPTKPWPTDEELAGYVAEYEAYLASTQCKDDELQQGLERGDWKVVKALALALIGNGACTLAEIRAKYRSL